MKTEWHRLLDGPTIPIMPLIGYSGYHHRDRRLDTVAARARGGTDTATEARRIEKGYSAREIDRRNVVYSVNRLLTEVTS